MIITAISSNRIHTISLPQKVKGQYWLSEETEHGCETLVSIEGIDGAWKMYSNRRVRILDKDDPEGKRTQKHAVLEPSETQYLQKKNGDRIIVFTEPVTEDRQVFKKYLAQDQTEITVGRLDNNDIVLPNRMVTSLHARLRFANGQWHLDDGDGFKRSTNGVFVNGVRFFSGNLNVGDCIFIMGYKIIVGRQFIAINNPEGKVRINPRKLREFNGVRMDPFATEEEEEYELKQDYFYRAPRFKRDVEKATFQIDSPPQSPITEELPAVLVMGSSMAMGVMSMMTLVNALTSNPVNTTSAVMGGGMLVGTVLLPIITRIYEKNRKKKKEALRQAKYKQYLADTAKQIEAECRAQEEILNENGITLAECESRIAERKTNLWERSPGQNDFLLVRVGQGEGLLHADIQYSGKHFTLDDDNLQDELYKLCETPKALHRIPICYSLYDNFISGVIGTKPELFRFAKGLIIQLAALYSYDEVKFVFLYDEADAEDFEFVKWLPHVWSDDSRFRCVATDANEVKELNAHFEGIINARAELNEADMQDVSPYYIVFALSKELTIRSEMIKMILSHKQNLHFSVIAFFNELNDLPKECFTVAELNGKNGKLYNKGDISGKATEFTVESELRRPTRELSVALANTSLDNSVNQFRLPKMITFLEMFNVGKVEHLNALNRWKENDPTKSLEAAIGVDTYGDLFKLDLHERFHGPHGLIAGMTGSGKSEFIITYILSLAVNYHPYEVAFVLIDYKGGGMAKSFENLPHTAGVITNLDGSAIKRSLISIESELKRRQAIFAETSKKVGVSNIDIYKYQKLYREGTVTEPLQHLFIISDEFAELKTQQAEFMTQLVSAARIGRSLGVHLILATQKPSGVVDDQIWSNSRFRVCMKVQERADSMDMLKRPEAAELVDTGRFYLQVGYNELFELGQSAWAGAPYYPSDKVYKEKDDSVIVIDRNGHPIRQAKIDRRPKAIRNPKKQLDAITQYLSEIAEEENIRIRPLWLEPIQPVILRDEICERYDVASEPYCLDPVVGEYDDPVHQQRCLLRLPLSAEGNAVVYGVSGSGKTMFLNAMLYSLIREHTPDEVHIYILDFASETLTAFSKAPHVGEVLLSYESEKIGNLFKMLEGEIVSRKKLFADYGGDYASYIRSSGRKLPSIVVAINNFAAFTEIYEEKEDAVSLLTREGTKYGIYFVLTSVGTGGVRFRLLQNFKQFFVMQLNDEADYSTVVGKTDGLYPAKHMGRGLVKKDALYEFQTASLTEDAVPFAFIREFCRTAAEAWTGDPAKKIPILPDRVDLDFIKDYIDERKVWSLPIGVEKNSLNVHSYPFDTSYLTMVLSDGDQYAGFIGGLSEMIGTVLHRDGTVFDPAGRIERGSGSLKRCATKADCTAAISELFALVRDRNNSYKDAIAEGAALPVFKPYMIVINGLTDLMELLEPTDKEKLSLILLKGQPAYQIAVVIGEKARNLSAYSYEKWCKTQFSAADGIWIGSGVDEQYQFKIGRITADMHEELTPQFGYSIRKGRAVRVKLLNTDEEGTQNDGF